MGPLDGSGSLRAVSSYPRQPAGNSVRAISRHFDGSSVTALQAPRQAAAPTIAGNCTPQQVQSSHAAGECNNPGSQHSAHGWSPVVWAHDGLDCLCRLAQVVVRDLGQQVVHLNVERSRV